MKHIFGPVKSRRLGNSLGINLTPYKTCSFDCIYCQLGKTAIKTKERKEYVAIAEIIQELKDWLENNPQQVAGLGYITLSGSGEPTLNLKIGDLIRQVKKICAVPVAVITNAFLLNDPLLRQELKEADLIVPSLDAVTQNIFERIDRPCVGVSIKDIIHGLTDLRAEFKGKIWLEVMLARGVNDDIRLMKRLKDVVNVINPDKIQLNSPVRSTTEPNVLAVDKNKLKIIKEILGDKAEII